MTEEFEILIDILSNNMENYSPDDLSFALFDSDFSREQLDKIHAEYQMLGAYDRCFNTNEHWAEWIEKVIA